MNVGSIYFLPTENQTIRDMIKSWMHNTLLKNEILRPEKRDTKAKKRDTKATKRDTKAKNEILRPKNEILRPKNEILK